MKRDDLILKDECFQVVGVLFSVYKTLGNAMLEKHYQKAISEVLRQKKIEFEEQVMIKKLIGEKVIGVFYVDFVIKINGQKIALEIKKNENFGVKNIQQTFNYIKILNLKLGILANFTKSGVKFKRIINLGS